MATREKTYRTQYAAYLERYEKLLTQGKIAKIEVGGRPVFRKPMSYEAFKHTMDDYMEEFPEDNKYTIGTRLASKSTHFTEKQYRVFRREVENNLTKLAELDVAAADEIRSIMYGKKNKQGKWLASAFEANAAEIMNIYFSVVGAPEIKS